MLHLPLASKLRMYKICTPAGRLLIEATKLILATSAPGVNGILMALPNPGSVSKKYSALIMLGSLLLLPGAGL